MKYRILFCCFLVPMVSLHAADLSKVSIFGDISVGSWLDRYEKYLNDSITYQAGLVETTVVTTDRHPDYHVNVIPFGNFGFKYTGDNVGATVVFGVSIGLKDGYQVAGATDQTFIKVEKTYAWVKQWFAEWYVNDRFTFLFGQDYVPGCFLTTSNQMWYDGNSMLNSGSMYGGRKPMLQLKFSTMKTESPLEIELKAAAIKVDTVGLGYFNGTDAVPHPLMSTKFPKFEGSADCNANVLGPFRLNAKVAGGWETYECVSPVYISAYHPDSSGAPITAWVYGAHGSIQITSPLFLSLSVDFSMGQNLGSYGLYVGNPFVNRLSSNVADLADIFYPKFSGSKALNSTTDMWNIIAAARPLSWLALEGGYGLTHADHEQYKDTAVVRRWHDMSVLYGQAAIKVMNAITFTPEFGQYLYGPKKGYGRMTYFGLATRLDF